MKAQRVFWGLFLNVAATPCLLMRMRINVGYLVRMRIGPRTQRSGLCVFRVSGYQTMPYFFMKSCVAHACTGCFE